MQLQNVISHLINTNEDKEANMSKVILRTLFLVATLFLVFNITTFAAETTPQTQNSAVDNKITQPMNTSSNTETTPQKTDTTVAQSSASTQATNNTQAVNNNQPTAVDNTASTNQETTNTQQETSTAPVATKAQVATAPTQNSSQATNQAAAKTAEQSATNATQAQPVKILHTNDMHGRILEEPDRVIGMAKLKTIKNQENPDLMLDSGDAFQGLPISNNTKGADMANAMNSVGYDAMAVGNHEFDFGLDQAIKYKEQLNFPILSSNTYKDGKLLFDPYTIINKNGINYGIIGVTTPETAVKTHPNNIKGVTFTEPIPAVQNVMKQINNQSDIFIILSHLGVDSSTKSEWRGDTLAQTLAKDALFKNKEIIVLDGHSHTVIQNGEINQNTLLAQTGTALANIGKVEFDYANGTVSNLKDTLINVADTKNVQPDAGLKQQLDQAKAAFDQQVSEVVIQNNPIQFVGERDDVRRHETNLGNAIADSMEAYAQDGFSHPADFAVTNGGGIRASIDKGKDVTLGDVITVLPFGNIISQIQVTGENVQKMFEHSLSAPTENNQLGANGSFLHISKSIRVYYDMNKAPGERVLKIEVMNPQTHQFEALDPNRTYYMTTNDFTASGGDGYDMLGGPREEGISLDKVFADYLKQADLSQYDTNEPSRIINGQPPVEATDDNTANVPNTDTNTDTTDIPNTGSNTTDIPATTTPVVIPNHVAQTTTSQQTHATSHQNDNMIAFPNAVTNNHQATKHQAITQSKASNNQHHAANVVAFNPKAAQKHFAKTAFNDVENAQQLLKALPTTGTQNTSFPLSPVMLIMTGLGVIYFTRKNRKAT